jgi:chemotaxis protein CheX
MSADTVQPPELNETVIEDVHAAVEKTFGQMFGLKVESKFQTIERGSEPPGDVAVIITLTSKEPQGAMILSFPKETVFNILKVFYKRDFTEVDNTVMGAVGEISNIIFGVFKQRVRTKGFQFGMAMPQISAGGAPRIPNVTWTSSGTFTSPHGGFHVFLVRVKVAGS